MVKIKNFPASKMKASIYFVFHFLEFNEDPIHKPHDRWCLGFKVIAKMLKKVDENFDMEFDSLKIYFNSMFKYRFSRVFYFCWSITS